MAPTLSTRQAEERAALRAFNESLSTRAGREPFAARMRELREIHGVSQYTAADHLNVDSQTYREMEANTSRFRRRDLVALAALYYPELPVETALQAAFPGAV